MRDKTGEPRKRAPEQAAEDISRPRRQIAARFQQRVNAIGKPDDADQQRDHILVGDGSRSPAYRDADGCSGNQNGNVAGVIGLPVNPQAIDVADDVDRQQQASRNDR